MKRTLTTLASAALLAVSVAAVPTRAEALPVWVVPAIIASGFVGVMTGAAIAHPRPFYAAPLGYAPTRCHFVNTQRPDGSWHKVELCNAY